MKYCKYILSFLVAFAFILPLSLGIVTAEPQSDDWLFIDGANVTREVECAVIYRNIERTGQNRWGYDVVVDAENKVTEIINNGEAPEGGTAIPNGGFVISASGSKIKWLQDNVSVGDTVFFDDYTQRFFVCDSNGNFNPYSSESFDLQEFGEGYMIAESEDTDFKVDFVYTVTVDANGRVIARGGKAEIPEGGTAIYATTSIARNNLIAYAPVGAVCKIQGNTATFTYSKDCLKKSMELALAQASQMRENAALQYLDIDYDAFDALIAEATEFADSQLDYKSLFTMMHRLESEIGFILVEGRNVELRAAFHTPEETTNEEVRKTILAAKRSGLNTIILRVSNGYGTFIPLPEDNRFSQDEKFNNFDLLKSYIKNCDTEGLSLILCFDVYYNEHAAIGNSGWLSQGSIENVDIANKFYSPANEEFKSYYLDYVKYVITNYDVDSVMFDSLRYPKSDKGFDLGYDDKTMRKFSAAYEIPLNEVKEIKTKLSDSDHWLKWVEFRTQLVNEMAEDISKTVKDARSDVNLFVVAERDTVNYYYCQDSVKWINDKLFDGVVVSVYDRDKDEMGSMGANAYYDGIVSEKCGIFAPYTAESSFLFAGLESSNGIGADLINSAINDVRSIDTNGFVLSNLTDFLPHVSEVNLKSSSAVSPLNEMQGSVKKILDNAWLRLYNVIYSGNGCDNDTLNLAKSKIDEIKASLESGIFTYEQAKELSRDMAVIFASAAAKNEALRDFKALEKMAKLTKVSIKEPEPEPEIPDESTPDDESSDVSESEPQLPEAESSVQEPISSVAPIDDNKIEIDFGIILIYGFVSLAGIGAIAAMVVGIKRKKSTPSNRHMPKGSAKGYEDKE